MLFSPIFSALLLAFAGTVLASPINVTPPTRNIANVACAVYNDAASPGIKWVNEGFMRQKQGDPEKKTNLVYSDWLKLRHHGGYTYSVSAGVGAGLNDDLFVEVVRSQGKGLGQQFKVEFFDNDGKPMVAYWISPNQRCTIKSPFNALALGGVQVYSRF